MTEHSLLTVTQAAAHLRSGAIIAYPTEAVFGLGCDPGSEQAVRRLLALKKRPAAAGLILIADSYERFSPFVAPIGKGIQQKAMSTWPGPVTWLFPRAAGVPDWLAGDHDTIALRITHHGSRRLQGLMYCLWRCDCLDQRQSEFCRAGHNGRSSGRIFRNTSGRDCRRGAGR